MNNEVERIAMSIGVSEDDSPGKISLVSNLSTDARNEEFGEMMREHYEMNNIPPANETDPNGKMTSYIYCNDELDETREPKEYTDICDRLYHEAKKKEKQRAMELREKLKQKKAQEKQKLHLAAKRSYTPIRTRSGEENIHDHLYSLSVQKQIDQKNKKREEEIENKLKGTLFITPKKKEEVVGRLYKRSIGKQQEGKKLRNEIEKKLAPRTPTPSKKLPLSQASNMYDRSLLQKARTERKIEEILNAPTESTFPKMRTQSRSKTRSNSRARSQTPSRRHCVRSQTPGRRESVGYRSTTPSRRKIYENMNNTEGNFYSDRGKNKLPPVSIKTRDQSPTLRS